MNKLLYIANWKMNKNFEESELFLDKFLSNFNIKNDIEVVICPSFLTLAKLDTISRYKNASKLSFGAQNVSDQKYGAFTGDISVEMLKDVKPNYCIVGHSERRQLYNESDSQINKKIKLLIEFGITPILCVGESLVQRENNEGKLLISNQLSACLKNIDTNLIIIAYEPIWAIGTGQSATVEDISEMNSTIKKQMNKLGYKDDQFYILYGGSVNIDNAKVLKTAESINGFLIGGASLDADNFLELIKKVGYMDTLAYICLIVFILVCIMLIGIILIQSSKSGMGAGLGGNTALNSAFGSAEADKLLVKATTGLAVLYMALAIAMSFLV